MVHPLVIDTQGAFNRCQMRDRILCQYGNAVGVDQVRDTVMDLRINVVWPSGQHDAASSCLIQIAESLLTFPANIFPALGHFFPGGMGSVRYFCGGNVFKLFQQPLCDGILIGHS